MVCLTTSSGTPAGYRDKAVLSIIMLAVEAKGTRAASSKPARANLLVPFMMAASYRMIGPVQGHVGLADRFLYDSCMEKEMLIAWIVGGASLAAWIVLIVGRGGFWLARPQLNSADASLDTERRYPKVVAVIPARNEEAVLGTTLPTVLNQQYAGELRVIVVDDHSEDDTASVARRAAEQSEYPSRLTVHPNDPLPGKWAGKVWAMNGGAQLAAQEQAAYIWFTDADIAHDPGMLRALVDKATDESLDLVSVMAQLRIDSRWDRLLIPAFVYFFAKLYPFRLVSNPRRRTAGAAGGCILVRRSTLEKAGGLEAIRSALIDDCALGRLIKRHGGRVWLGFTRSVWSVRVYGTLRSIWDMVARSAFHQLGYSVWQLIGTLLGMLLIYAAPPVATLAGIVCMAAGIPGSSGLALFGGATWGLMTLSFLPILRHQRAGLWMAPLLPLAGVLYTAMTLSSAWRHATGRSGMWKGRTYSRHTTGRSGM
ncbi:glycosyltransferase [Candidatus Bipolaricaulota bacterium]